MAFCPKCGAKMNERAAFCTSCGATAEAVASAGASPAAPPPVERNCASGAGATAPSLMTRVTNILTNPKQEWPVIDRETTSVTSLFTGYVAILAAIPAIAAFIGAALLGVYFTSVLQIPLAAGLGGLILTYVLSLGGVYLAALIIEKLAPTFQSQGTINDALKLVAYSYTALWVAGICSLLPVIGILGVLAGIIYSIYLFYLGVPVIMKTPQDKVVVYMIAAAIVIIVIRLLRGERV